MFRGLRWHLAKRRLAHPSEKLPPGQVKRFFRLQREKLEDLPPPNAEDYQRLAALYDDLSAYDAPDYGRFCAAAQDYYRRPLRAFLDLACGTGLLTRQFAARADTVVGLDRSEDMLREARARTAAGNVRFVRQDFRDFSLGETFDAAACGGDSLNYLGAPGELAEVLRCVRRHLRPGGLFAFDVLDESAYRALAHLKVVASVGGEWFEFHNYYDPGSRVGECRSLFQGSVARGNGNKVSWAVVERHRRIPIEEEDGRRAAGAAGLGVAEHFHADHWLFPLKGLLYLRQFYVLRRPA
jgi:SAM-dependent methyltransferase